MKNVCDKLMGKAAEKRFCSLYPCRNFLWWLAYRSTYTTKTSVNSGQYSSNNTTQDLTNIKLNHWPFSNTPSHTTLAFLLISSLWNGVGLQCIECNSVSLLNLHQKILTMGAKVISSELARFVTFMKIWPILKGGWTKYAYVTFCRGCRIDDLCKCPCIYHLWKSTLSKY